MVMPPTAVLSIWTGIPCAAWSGESMVGSSPSRWNTMVSGVPWTSSFPDQFPVWAFARNAAESSNRATARIFFMDEWIGAATKIDKIY